MKNSTSDLAKVIEQTIDDLENDPKLSEKYSNIIAYSSEPNYRKKVVDKAVNLIDNEGISNIFEALSQIENQIFTND